MKTRDYVRREKRSLKNNNLLFLAMFLVAIIGFGYLKIFENSKLTMDYREQSKVIQNHDLDRKSANSAE